MESVPSYVNILFILVILTTIGFFLYAFMVASPEKKDNTPTIILTFIGAWVLIISLATFYGFFQNFESWPPRFIFLVGPLITVIIIVLSVGKSRRYLLKLPLTTLTYIHIIRVPVEIMLWWLAGYGVVATAMTFEGGNFDILSGITAPFAGVFLVGKRIKSRIGAILWNLIALGLLINVVTRAISATPWFFDPSLFDNPNIAVFYWPFVFLPGLVVPAVLFCHLVSLIKLLGKQDENGY